MKSNRILLALTITLLAVNLVLAYLLWNSKRDRHDKDRKQERGDWIAKELDLTETQKSEHKKLKDAHFNTLKPLYDSMTQARRDLYALIRQPNDSAGQVTAYADRIGFYHARISQLTFAHFKQVRTLLNPDQQVKMDSLVQRIVTDMGRRRGGSKDRERRPQE